MIDRWPIDTLCPRDRRFSPMGGAARYGGRTLGGSVRATSWLAGGIWRGTYFQIGVYSPEEVLVLEQLEAVLDGGAQPIAVPLLPGLRAPTTLGAPVPHSDDTSFSDGTMYVGGDIRGMLTAPASLFGTTISFKWAGRVHLLGGDFEVMSPEGPRAHRIKRFVSRAGSAGAFTYQVEISPPLRCDLATGAEMNFADPHVMVRLANPEAFAPVLQYGLYGFIDAEWVEA